MRKLRDLLSEYLARVALHQSSAILTLVYFGIVVPTGIALRLRGKRLLPDSFGSGRSHWIARDPAAKDAEALARQF